MYTALHLAREHPMLGIGFGINNLEERFPDRYQQLYGERVFRFHAANQVIDLLVGTGSSGRRSRSGGRRASARARSRRWRTRRRTASRVIAAGGLGACVAIAAHEPR